jgi:hypothetical protein
MLYICIFSNKFALNQATSVSHIVKKFYNIESISKNVGRNFLNLFVAIPFLDQRKHIADNNNEMVYLVEIYSIKFL